MCDPGRVFKRVINFESRGGQKIGGRRLFLVFCCRVKKRLMHIITIIEPRSYSRVHTTLSEEKAIYKSDTMASSLQQNFELMMQSVFDILLLRLPVAVRAATIF